MIPPLRIHLLVCSFFPTVPYRLCQVVELKNCFAAQKDIEGQIYLLEIVDTAGLFILLEILCWNEFSKECLFRC